MISENEYLAEKLLSQLKKLLKNNKKEKNTLIIDFIEKNPLLLDYYDKEFLINL